MRTEEVRDAVGERPAASPSAQFPAPTSRVVRWIAELLQLAAMLAAAIVCFDHVDLPLLPALVVGLVLVAVVVHECGHALFGRLAGMTVARICVGRIERASLRQGARWRWRKTKPPIFAGVMAVPDARLPIARQMAWLAAGGPAMNAIVAVLAGLAWAWQVPGYPFYGAFALVNLGMSISNLVPMRRQIESDGMVLMRMLRTRESDDSLVALRLHALCVSGVTADELPDELLQRLERAPTPAPLMRLWFRLKSLQNLGRWREAGELEPAIAAARERIEPERRPMLEDMFGLMAAEARFSRALDGGADADRATDLLPPEFDWLSPGLRMRMDAADLVRAGRRQEAQALLERSAREFARGLDRAAERSEARMRAAILANAA